MTGESLGHELATQVGGDRESWRYMVVLEGKPVAEPRGRKPTCGNAEREREAC